MGVDGAACESEWGRRHTGSRVHVSDASVGTPPLCGARCDRAGPPTSPLLKMRPSAVAQAQPAQARERTTWDAFYYRIL